MALLQSGCHPHGLSPVTSLKLVKTLWQNLYMDVNCGTPFEGMNYWHYNAPLDFQ